MTDTARQRAERLAAQPLVKLASGPGNFFGGTIAGVREMWERRELQGILIRREMKNRYKDSTLGFLWTLIKPIAMLLIYVFVVGELLSANRGVPSFAIYVFTGLTIWGLYSDMLTSSTMSILQNAALIKKVYLPRQVFPFASVGSAVLNFLVQMCVLIAAILVLRQVPITWNVLYIFPAILVVIIFGAALALTLSSLNVFFRDVQYLVEVAVTMLFWASPIVYSYRALAESQYGGTWVEQLYLLNPITIAVIAFQKALWLGGPDVQATFAKEGIDPAHTYPPDLDLRIVVMLVVGLVFLWFADRLFHRLQGNFAQEI